MKWFIKIISILAVLAGAAIGLWFYLENMNPVTVNWFGSPVEGIQLALWLLLFFVAGALLGLSVSAVQSLRHQVRVHNLKKQLKVMKQKSSGRPV